MTTKFYFGALRTCLSIPQADLHLTPLSAHQRRIAMLTSSQTHGCMYCTAHSAAVGDVLTGAFSKKCERGGVTRPFDKVLPGDMEIKQLVAEVCTVPAIPVSTETVDAFIGRFSKKAYVQLTGMVAFAAWLNFVMSALDMELEMDMRAFASSALSERGEAEVVAPRKKGMLENIGSGLRNAGQVAGLLPSAASAQRKEMIWFSGVPAGSKALDKWAMKVFGMVPRTLRTAQCTVAKRGLGFGLREVLLGDCEWSRAERVKFMYVFGRSVRNEAVVEDAIGLLGGEFVGRGRVVGKEKARETLEKVYQRGIGFGRIVDRFDAAVRYVIACSGPNGGCTAEVQVELLERVSEPRSVIDLAGMVGVFAFGHRLVVMSEMRLTD